MSSEMRMHDDEGRCLCGCTENCAVAAELRGEITRLRAVVNRMVEEDNERFASEALLARTEAGAVKCSDCDGDGETCLAGRSAHRSNWIKCAKCNGTGDAAPVAVAWVLAYPDGSISSFAAVYRRKENAEKHIASYGGSLGLVPMPLYTHPQDASGDAELREFAQLVLHGIESGNIKSPLVTRKVDGDYKLESLYDIGVAAMQAKEAK